MTPWHFRPTFALLSASLLLASGALPAFAAPPGSPEAFVRRVYALYRDRGPGVSTRRPEGAAYYAPALLDAFAKDDELAHGEVGAIDADPICACQDFGKLRVRRVTVTPAEAGTVKARVDFTNLQYHEIVTLRLQPTPAGWRIADVGSKDMPSVMAVLLDSIAHPTQEDAPGKADPAPPQP